VTDFFSYEGRDTLPPDGYLQPKRFKITCRCLRCGELYSWVTKKITDDDRPCPKKKCKAAALEEQIEREVANRTKMFEEQRAPGVIGDKPIVKAIDTTANIVMEDHHLTDLKDNIREGEPMAPKLPPQQQRAADEFFSGKAVMEQAGVQNRQAQLMGRRAIAGAYRGMAISPGVVGGTPGEKVLRSVRKI
jgi:hypothetical protein